MAIEEAGPLCGDEGIVGMGVRMSVLHVITLELVSGRSLLGIHRGRYIIGDTLSFLLSLAWRYR